MEPIPVMVRRYDCPHCGHRRAKRDAIVAHIGRCWQNPAANGCKTCLFYDYEPSGPPCFPEYPCGCNDGWERCHADVSLSDGLKAHCPSWQPRPEESQ